MKIPPLCDHPHSKERLLCRRCSSRLGQRRPGLALAVRAVQTQDRGLAVVAAQRLGDSAAEPVVDLVREALAAVEVGDA